EEDRRGAHACQRGADLRRRHPDRYPSGPRWPQAAADRAGPSQDATPHRSSPRRADHDRAHRGHSRNPTTRLLPGRRPAHGASGRTPMNSLDIVPSALAPIRTTLVGLKMPRALEVLDHAVRQLERGETSALEVIDTLFAEELTLRENRRVKMALRMAKLSTVKTLAGFDFSFQPSLDRNRILALAQLDFIERNEVIHLLGPPGTGKSHLATPL